MIPKGHASAVYKSRQEGITMDPEQLFIINDFESGDPEAEYYLLEYEPGPPEPEPEDWPDDPFILDGVMTPID